MSGLEQSLQGLREQLGIVPAELLAGMLKRALNEVVDALDMKGGGLWTPVRQQGRDYSSWGQWEVWEFCRCEEREVSPGCIAFGAWPTGEWIAWDSVSGQQMGYPDKKKAEMMAVYLNGGKAPTRIVASCGSASASKFRFEDFSDRVDAELERVSDAYFGR